LPAPFAQFLNFEHTVVRPQRCDQFVGSPRVGRHEVIRSQRAQAAVRGLIRSAQPRQHRLDEDGARTLCAALTEWLG
jgi:hypothetical protein